MQGDRTQHPVYFQSFKDNKEFRSPQVGKVIGVKYVHAEGTKELCFEVEFIDMKREYVPVRSIFVDVAVKEDMMLMEL